MLSSFFQLTIDGLVKLLGIILSFLPPSPFSGIYELTIDSQLLSALAWIVPFPQILALLQAWIAAITIFYLYQIALRWIKAVG